jgi:hypothetical protein
MPIEGVWLTEEAVGRIVDLLLRTDMTITDIAHSMCCSRSAVLTINRKFQIRRIPIRKDPINSKDVA